MQHSTNTITIEVTQQDRLIAKWTLLAIGLHMLETVFPSILPGVKPGVANIVVLYVMLHYGWKAALWVSMLRVFASGLLLGYFLSPTFFLSLAGALLSLAVLGLMQSWPKRYFSVVSMSLLAAMAHVTGQILLVSVWLIPNQAVLVLLPPLLLSAILFGLVNGLVVIKLNQTLKLTSANP